MNSPQLPLSLVEVKGNRSSARGQIRGAVIEVVVPAHWSAGFKTQISQRLYQQLRRTFIDDWQLVHHYTGPLISFEDKHQLHTWVTELNDTTLHVDVKKVILGSSKYSRLAQMNTQLKQMTVSRFCVDRAPESALRYLIVHELAHLIEANHSRRFWQLVKAHVPDYRYQSRLMEAVHRVRLYEHHADPATEFSVMSSEGNQLRLPMESGTGA